MKYFNNAQNVDEYIKMADGYDGRDLITILQNHLPSHSTVLELGMGPGKDLDILAEKYEVTGSDSSSVFLDLYRKTHPKADLLQLDAVSIKTDRNFDCIYSNKVLHHLHKSEIHQSFRRQRELLTGQELLMHSFWYGNSEEEYNGLWFAYYEEEELLGMIGDGFTSVAAERYTELEKDDSFYILLRKSED